MQDRPMLTVTAAVASFQVERRTLQRLLAAGQLAGTRKDSRGRWMIPVEALHAAGFAARTTWIPDATTSAPSRNNDATSMQSSLLNQGDRSATGNTTERDSNTTELRSHVARLQDELAAEKQLREAAERNTEDLRMAMRMLEAAVPAKRELPRRRWWQKAP